MGSKHIQPTNIDIVAKNHVHARLLREIDEIELVEAMANTPFIQFLVKDNKLVINTLMRFSVKQVIATIGTGIAAVGGLVTIVFNNWSTIQSFLQSK